MTGQQLIDLMRQNLRDTGAFSPDSALQGQFWSDYELLLFLNMAQDTVLDNALVYNNEYILSHLHAATTQQGLGDTDPVDLPNDYMHYQSAVVEWDESYLSMAKLYMGGEGEYYRDTQQHMAWIDRDVVKFYSNGVPVRGILYYYKYPAEITIGDFNETFGIDVYNNLIVKQALVFAGLKEPQTQREFKNYIDARNTSLIIDPKLFNYIEHRELSDKILQGAQ
jgi:hypothetical protein